MGYVEAVNLAFSIVGYVMGALLLHFVVFAIVGLFAKKKFPESKEKCRIGVIISARNEEKVIGNLINSIRACDYPQDKVDIFVVAHNCTDSTAEVCRALGAHVYEYNNPNEKRVGYAYKHLYAQVIKDYGAENFDAFLVMNADNTVTKNYLQKMSDAFIACGKKNIITSFRNSSNFNQNYMSCMYGISFAWGCRFEMRGRTVCGCSARVLGTGYMVPSEFVKNGWDYVTLTEDLEFTVDKIVEGVKAYYCDEAEFFDEQPTTVPIMLRQRLRWARGRIVVFFRYFKALLASIFHPKKYSGGNKNIVSKYDITAQIFPLVMLSVFNTLLQIILLAFCPLFGYDAGAVFAQYFIGLGYSTAASYVGIVLVGILLFICEHKRIKVGFFRAFFSLLLYPIFLLADSVLYIIAFFKKNVEWKPIPHYGYDSSGKQKTK